MLISSLKELMAGRHLQSDTMAQVMGTIMDGQASAAQVAAILVALRLKGETVDEIVGAARAMRERMTHVEVTGGGPMLDTCGTGGDGAGTFNISTAVAFVAAGAGAVVAKHGNRAISSKSGSADVLAALGVNLNASHDQVARCIKEIGIGFLFAPALHPAMKNAAPIRRELGVRTIFNVLGPLTNPARATHQLLGVFSRDLVVPLAEVLGQLGAFRAWVVHSADGLDELSIGAESYVAQWDGHKVTDFVLSPHEAGLPTHPGAVLGGGDAQQNAQVMRELLAGKLTGPIADAVALNAGAALVVYGLCDDLKAGVQRAREVLAAGLGLEKLDQLIELSTQN